MSYAIYLNRPSRNIRKELVTLLIMLVQLISARKETLRINLRNSEETELSKHAGTKVTTYDKSSLSKVVASYVPSWDNCTASAKQSYANDIALVMGGNFTSPAKALITFAGRNSLDPVIVCAKANNIPVINLSDRQTLKNLIDKVRAKREQLNK